MPHCPMGRRGRRATVVSWNAGGLTTELYRQMLHWLDQTKVDIILIQGTRWKDDRTWQPMDFILCRVGNALQPPTPMLACW